MSERISRIYEFGPLSIDAEKRVLMRDGETVPLTPKAFDTLLVLVEHHGEVLEKDRLMEMLWPDSEVEEANLSLHISAVRKALGESPHDRKYIVTVPGKGYKFAADIKGPFDNKSDLILARYTKSTVVISGQGEGQEIKRKQEGLPPASLPSARRRKLVYTAVAVAILAVGVAGVYYLRLAPSSTVSTPPVRSIAVLPFKPLVAENRDEALELGMADALITKLSNTRGVIVRPLNSARRYGGIEQDPLAAGRELQVDSVLDGSIQRWGDRIRVTARLVSVGGEQLWAGQFDDEFTDIFAVQDAISGRVVGALALHLSGEEERRLTKRYTDNAAAYELYLKGRYHLFKLTPTEVRKGVELFQEAVEVDPAYALAYTGIADAYRTLPITSDVAPKDAFPNAKEAVTKALERDDSLAEAHAILGWIKFWFDWDWAGSESEFRRAIDLNPNNADAHRGYAHLLSNTRRHEEALREVGRARELDPLSLITNTLQGQFLHFAGRDDEAVRRFEKTIELDPNFWVAHINLAFVLIHKKMYGQALTELGKAREQSGGNTQTISLTGYVMALSGERERARGVLEELRRLSGQRYVPPYNLAMVYHGLGERQEALAWLERAYEERDVLLTFAAVDPKWDNLRQDPRFQALLRRVGFLVGSK